MFFPILLFFLWEIWLIQTPRALWVHGVIAARLTAVAQHHIRPLSLSRTFFACLFPACMTCKGANCHCMIVFGWIRL